MELGSYFLFLQEQIKDIIIIKLFAGDGHLRSCVCLSSTKLFAWGESGGHASVLRERTTGVTEPGGLWI